MAELVVPIGVSLEPFKASMDEAARVAQGAVNQIQQSFNNANIGISGSIIQGIGQGFGQGLFSGLENLLKKVKENIEAMAHLSDQAKLTRTDIETFQELQAAGSKSGLTSKQSADDLVKVAGLLNDARRTENDLTKLLDENNIKFKDRRGQVIGLAETLTIAAKLISNAQTPLDAEKIATMLGLSKEWVKVLQEGPEALARIAEQAHANGTIMSAEMVDKAKAFEVAWTNALQSLGQTSKEWLLPIIDGLNTAIRFANDLTSSYGAFNRLQEGTATREDLNIVRKMQLSRADQELVAARQAQIDSENRITVRPQTPVKEGGTKIPGAKDDDDTKSRYDSVTEAVQRHTAALVADANAVGFTAGKHEALRAELKLLEAAREDDDKITDEQIAKYGELRRSMEATQALQAAGITLSKEQASTFLRVASSASEAATKLAETRRSFEGANEAMRYAGNQLVDILDQATQKGAKFGDIMASVLRNVAKQMMLAAITGEGAFAKMLGTASSTGGTGGIAGFLLGAFKGGGGSSTGVLAGGAELGFGGIGHAAEGGVIPAGGLAYVGEHGPNPRLLRAGGEPIMVTPNDVSGSSGGGNVVGQRTSIVIQGNADDSVIAKMQQMLAARDKRFVADVAHATSELRRRSVFA